MQRSINITGNLIWSFLFLLFAHFANAQEGQNPFDLEHRLNEKKEQSSNQGIKPQDNQVAPPASNNSKAKNPFDLDRSTESQVQQTPSTQPDQPENPFDLNTPPEESNDLKAAPPLKQAKKEEASGFVFWAILLLTVFLALEITLFKSLIIKVYRAFTNDNILKLLHREQRDIIAFPYLLLYIFFFVSFGIFTFLTFYSFGYIQRSLSLLLYCIGGVGVLFLLKHILLKIVEIIFPVDKEIKQYSFSLVIFSSILGLALVPFNIIVAFASDSLAQTALYGGLLTIFGITVFCILRGLFLGSKYLSFHKFHFFMYLCTVEIAPVVIVVKLLLLKAGIH